MLGWNKVSTREFYGEYEGRYAGDTLASEIIRLPRRYIGKLVLDVGAGSGVLINRIPNAIGIDLVSNHPRIITGDISLLVEPKNPE